MSEIQPGKTEVPVGVTKGPDFDPDPEVRPYPVLNLSRVKSLTELVKEYRFFSPGCMHLSIPVAGDLREFYRSMTGKDVSLYTFRTKLAALNGMLDLNDPVDSSFWCHSFLAVPVSEADDFQKVIASIAIFDRNLGKLARVRTQDIWIYDPLQLINLTTLPEAGIARIPVTAFVVETNYGSFYFDRQPDHWEKGKSQYWSADSFRLFFDPNLIYPSTVKMANALLAERSNPYEAANDVESDLPAADTGGSQTEGVDD